jgi:hypothetical protein
MKNISPRTWRARLLSGKYLRAAETLKGMAESSVEEDWDKTGFCCLGVYADLVGIPLPELDNEYDSEFWETADIDDPVVAAHEAGELAASERPWWMSEANMKRLMNLNDNIEEGPNWGAKGGVIDYIDRCIIPKYDKRKKAQK